MTRTTAFIALILWFGLPGLTPAVVHAEEKAATVKAKALPPVSEAKAIQFAESMITAIQDGDDTDKFIDWAALIDRSALGLNVPLASKNSFRQGVQTGAGTAEGLFGQIRKQIEMGGSYKSIRVFEDADGTRVKLRLMPAGGGVNFHDYLLKEVRGEVIAIDLKIALAGEDFSQIMRRFLIQIVASENRGFLDKLTGKESALLKHVGDLQAMTLANQGGHPEEVAGIVAQLPEEIRNEKLCLLGELQAAQALADNDKMATVIERYRRVYPEDPAIDLLSIDYFALKMDLAQALISAERFKKSTGDEAYMQTMIADLQWQSGKLKQARSTINKAIEMEPDFVNAHWTLVAIAASEKDHTAVRETLQNLAKNFGVVLDPNAIRAEPMYAEFAKSPEFDRLVKFINAQ